MRSTTLALAGLLIGTGCRPGIDRSNDWTMFAHDAQVHPTNHDGAQWCPNGALPSVSVRATLDGVSAETTPLVGLTPQWVELLLTAPAGQYSDGVLVDVIGRCDQEPFRIGAALIHPSAGAVRTGALALERIGNVDLLRIWFVEESGYGSDYGSGYYDPGYGGDYYPYDTATDSPDGWDDGSGDSGGGDSGGGDSGGGDSGGGDSGGGDCGGGDGTDSLRIQSVRRHR